MIEPRDEWNRALLANVHPDDWKNPTPADRYDLVVIGAGTAGLISASGAAGLGAKVALVERAYFGGDCLNVGCVPSKALLASAHAAADARAAHRLGVRVPDGVTVDFARVMERMRRLRADISPVDSVERYSDELGVDVFLGTAAFRGADEIAVGDARLRFKRAVIATGGRPVVPPALGLPEAGYLTNETIFELTLLPRRLLVLGGGPIGCELAQAFRRFGAEVTIVEMADQFLIREDPDAARVLREALERDGIDIRLQTTVSRVEANGSEKRVTLEHGEKTETVAVDAVLVSVGRAPNVEGLELDAAGVAHDEKGVTIDDHFQTTNPRIYAAGDICLPYQFTHAADFTARSVVQNALFSFGGLGRKKLSALTIPWCTYTSPEVAHVGMYERDARERGIEIDTWTRPFEDVDRARAESDTDGFVKIHTRRGKDEILGATIVARNAGDLLSEISVAMAGGVGLGRLASVIHPYPTHAEAIRQLGDAYNRTRVTPAIAKLLAWIIRLRR